MPEAHRELGRTGGYLLEKCVVTRRIAVWVGMAVAAVTLLVTIALKVCTEREISGLLHEDASERALAASRIRARGGDPVLELLRIASPRLGPYPECSRASDESVRAARLLWDEDIQAIRAALVNALRGDERRTAYAAMTLAGSERIEIDSRLFWSAVHAARDPSLQDPLRRLLPRWKDRIPALVAEAPDFDVDLCAVPIVVELVRPPLGTVDRARLLSVEASQGSAQDVARRALLGADRPTTARVKEHLNSRSW